MACKCMKPQATTLELAESFKTQCNAKTCAEGVLKIVSVDDVWKLNEKQHGKDKAVAVMTFECNKCGRKEIRNFTASPQKLFDFYAKQKSA